jgi:integrase
LALIGHHPTSVFTYVCRRPRAGQRKGERYPITYEGGKSEWQATRKRAGVAGFRFHDVRHDMATKLLRETGNLKLVSIALNHSDTKTSARYAHVMDGEVADALQRVAVSRTKSRTKASDAA